MNSGRAGVGVGETVTFWGVGTKKPKDLSGFEGIVLLMVIINCEGRNHWILGNTEMAMCGKIFAVK